MDFLKGYLIDMNNIVFWVDKISKKDKVVNKSTTKDGFKFDFMGKRCYVDFPYGLKIKDDTWEFQEPYDLYPDHGYEASVRFLKTIFYLGFENIKVKQIFKDTVDKNDLNLMMITTVGRIDNVLWTNCFLNFLTKECKVFFIENNIQILIDATYENEPYLFGSIGNSTDHYFRTHILKDLVSKCAVLGMKYEKPLKVNILMNNVYCEEQYENFLKSNFKDYGLERHDSNVSIHFSPGIAASYHRWIKRSDKLLSETFKFDKNKKTKHWICLNQMTTSHRLYFLSKLHHMNILNKGYFSFAPFTGMFDEKLEGSYTYYYPIDMGDKSIKYIYDKIPLKLESVSEEKYPKSPNFESESHDVLWDIPPQTNEAYVWISTESTFSHIQPLKDNQITEKTFKPLIIHKPFLVVGGVGTLKQLREWGFKTFPELFDESYDEEEDMFKRMKMILNETKKLSEMPLEELHDIYLSMEDKLIYNSNHFLNNFKSILKEQHKKMLEKIYNE
jgi:hypothetical protein